MATIYEKIKFLCEKEGFAISSLSNYIPGLSVNKASISGWKNGAKPRPGTVKKIADYFGVPVSYFYENESAETGGPVPGIGRDPTKKEPPTVTEDGEQLAKFNDLFSRLSPERQALFLDLLQFFADRKE